MTEIKLDAFANEVRPVPGQEERQHAISAGEIRARVLYVSPDGVPYADQQHNPARPQSGVAATHTKPPPTTSRYPTFDIDEVLPTHDNFLRAYYDEGSKEDTPNEFHLWCALAVLSLAAGRRVLLKQDTPVTCNLAICLTGATTVGKSRALSHAVRLVRRRMRWSAEDMASVRLVDNPGSGEFLVSELVNELKNPTNPKAPGVKRPVKALIRFEELSIFVSKSGAQAGILRQMVMGLANGDDYIGRGSITNGSDAAEDAFATLVATTQTKSLRHLFSDRDRVSGLLNRFVFAQGTPKTKRSRGGSPLDFTDAERQLKVVRSWVLTEERMIDFDESGGPAWDRFFYEKVVPAMEADTSDILSRLDLTLMRLVLLFAINDCAESIDASHVRSAEAMFEYLVACSQQVDTGLSMAKEDAIKHRLLELVERMGGDARAPVSQGQLLDKAKSLAAKDELEAYLRRLKQQGLVDVEPHKGARGPATFRWTLTDAGRDHLNGIFH